MTTKEAKKLVDKFKPHVNPYIGSGMLANEIDDNAVLMQAKQCALIAQKRVVDLLKQAQESIDNEESSDILQFYIMEETLAAQEIQNL